MRKSHWVLVVLGTSALLSLLVLYQKTHLSGAPALPGRQGKPLPAERPARALQDPHLEVHKSRRRLILLDGNREVRAWRIGLGRCPVGPKERQGDCRTPEGTYYVCLKNPRSKYNLALGLSYPNAGDAARALAKGLISQQDCDRITHAIAARQAPPWDTRLGGEICIHGHGSAKDWTLGCIALDDADMAELYAVAPRGAEVLIKP